MSCYVYDNDESSSLSIGPFNPDDGNFADMASFRLRYAFFMSSSALRTWVPW